MQNIKDWDVVVVGGAHTDFIVRAERFPRPSEIVHGFDFTQEWGGKGVTQAIAASRLGAKVALVTKVGRDLRANSLYDSLELEGVDTRHVVQDAELATGASVVVIDSNGAVQIATSPGANARLWAADVNVADETIARSCALLAQLDVPMKAVLAAISIARTNEVPVIVDAAPVPHSLLPRSFYEQVDVIRMNSLEARALSGIEVNDRDSATRAAEKLLGFGAKAAIVQADGQGNVLLCQQGELWLPHFQVKSVEVFGAGDAFSAALAAEISRGKDLMHAALFANAAAALATMRPGKVDSLPMTDDVLELLNTSGDGEVQQIADTAA